MICSDRPPLQRLPLPDHGVDSNPEDTIDTHKPPGLVGDRSQHQRRPSSSNGVGVEATTRSAKALAVRDRVKPKRQNMPEPSGNCHLFHRPRPSPLNSGHSVVESIGDEGWTMKRRFSDEQIIAMIKEHEAGAKASDLCRRYGISDATFYKYKAKFGGMTVSDAKKLRALEEENARLKRLLADAMLDNAALKDLATKNF